MLGQIYADSFLQEQKFLIENLKQSDWIKINFHDYQIYLLYTKKMLNDCFPQNQYTPLHHLNKINETLETEIKFIEAEKYYETVQTFKRFHYRFLCNGDFMP